MADGQAIISPDNRSFKYGDGCFETMKVIDGEVLLHHLHFQRLFSSLQTLQFTVPAFFTPAYLIKQILELLHLNLHQQHARVRLVVYRGNGGLHDLDDHNPHFIIQTWPGSKDSNNYDSKGLTAGFFPDAKKSADAFSSIKSNNYLGYAMGAIWAKKHQLNEGFLTNAFGRVADATIANIFIIHNAVIKTPALSEGCVNGVMRRYLLQRFAAEGMAFYEAEITQEELLDASEVFLTNAIYGIRWVKSVGGSNYTNETSALLYKKFISPLFNSTTI